MLDKVSANASQEGTTTNITKMVAAVTVNSSDGDDFATIDNGLSFSMDDNLLKKFLWALLKPILMSLFTPQVMLLIYFNFELLGITKTNVESFATQDFTKILNYILNSVFKIIKTIILFVKDKLIELLLEFFYEKVMPLLIKYKLLLVLEYITYWLGILKSALKCIPIYLLKLPKIIGSIDNVDYADIETPQNTPEATSSC
jgi:hypothetical protein